MPAPLCVDPAEVFLQPGEWHFGGPGTRIRTLLGSCVSFTAWHADRRLGAMCHYVLPRRARGAALPLDGRYGEDAVRWFVREALARRTRPEDYEFKVFGGGDMYARGEGSVGRRNLDHILEALDAMGHQVTARHVGGTGHRNVLFDVDTGAVWLRHVPLGAVT